MQAVDHYGDPRAEYRMLQETGGVMDLSFRSRLCLTGADRVRFLNGQVTNNIKALSAGQGCYAALVSNKGKMESDLNIYSLPDELLLDFEPGLAAKIAARFDRFIIADDVQVVNVSELCGLLSVQGPKAAEIVTRLNLPVKIPDRPFQFTQVSDAALGEVYCMNRPRGTVSGFDLFAPGASMAAAAERLIATARELGGGACGWQALEMARIEAGLPRYGMDMDESNLAPETGIGESAISYSKGCYIGQEVIARIRTYGQVAKSLRGLWLADDLPQLPRKGDKLFHGEKEAGYVTSALASPAFQRKIALGYVRREHNQPGGQLELQTAAGRSSAVVTSLPFAKEC